MGREGKKRKINKERQYKEKCSTYAVISACGLICICCKLILRSISYAKVRNHRR
jgi:hypothetical protein